MSLSIFGRIALMWLALWATALLPAFAAAPAPAATPSPATADATDLEHIYEAAMNSFNAGDFRAAAAGLEKVVTQAPADAKLEPVFFTLGAAYFNLGEFGKAAGVLQTYRTKFPSGSRLAEATFSLGRAALLNHDFETAAGAFKNLEDDPLYRSQALLLEGTALKDAGDAEAAIVPLEKLVSAGIHDGASANGALLLAVEYGQRKQSAKAVALLDQIRQQTGLLENPAQFNTLATETGDSLLAQKLPKEALACYRAVRSRAGTIQLETQRIDTLQQELNQQIAQVRANPKNAAQFASASAEVRNALADAKQLLTEYQKLPDYEPALLVRMGTCFSQMNKPWEAVVVYEELLRRYPHDPTREPTLFALISASADVGRTKRARALCEEYLKEFPDGPNAEAVGYLGGAIALQANDAKGAETYFGRLLSSEHGGNYRESMRFLLGNAQFSQGEYDAAAATYAKYLSEYPTGKSAEEATYRGALCSVFSGAYEKAMEALTAYVKAYPKGDFVPDARYRLAVCQYAASQYEAVLAACNTWEHDFGQNPLRDQVLALKGDALAASSDNPGAIDAYLQSYKASVSPEVADYSIFAAEKLLQKAGDWPRIGEIFEGYVRDHPDQPAAVMAIYWIGKARAHEGKTEEAKKFVADTIQKYLADPTRGGVEALLTQLATLCVRKKMPPHPDVAGVTAPPSTVPPPDPDPDRELETLLGGVGPTSSPLVRARILFAESELARLRRQVPAQQKYLDTLSTDFKPAELSAPLLATVGDHLLEKKQYANAAPYFSDLISTYPKSEFLEYGYNGLGEIAYADKDYPKALAYFNDAVDKAAAAAKLKDVTVGQAKTLLALGRLDEAKALFEQVAATREWRGESTAFAIYSLGDIMRQQKKLAEAISYYQRVFVAYQRYLPWVAKAYAASAECLAELGKNKEAADTYRELLKNPKLQDSAEAEIARNYLQKVSHG